MWAGRSGKSYTKYEAGDRKLRKNSVLKKKSSLKRLPQTLLVGLPPRAQIPSENCSSKYMHMLIRGGGGGDTDSHPCMASGWSLEAAFKVGKL